MNTPIGYYCNYTPGDRGLLGEMENAWGSRLEELNQSELLWVLTCVVQTMTAVKSENYNPNDVGDRIDAVDDRFDELSFSDQLGLAKSILSQF